ncbi:MAG: B12-binding domain-containing radical SAM protein [Syntrophaceae bacterium]|nr:B12-binding domain-containing radical SAM protein [Syntrophaceae bacterium]
MKIAFFNIAYENLAISILSAIAKKEGHCVKLLHTPTLFKDGLTREFKRLSKLFSNDRDILTQLDAYQPDLIAFSVATFHYQTALYYAEICRNRCPNAKIVFGGIHVSCVPEVVIANDFIDYVVIGEGETAFIEIIKHIEKGAPQEPIVNTWYKSSDGNIIKGKQIGFIQDLDSLPHYDKEIWKEIFPLKTYYLTMASRGCPYNCSYCFNHFFRNIPDEKSNYVRRRSVKHVIDELVSAKEKYKITLIEFWDDIFIFDKKWLKEFLEIYKREVNLPFKCYIHVNLFDEEIAIGLKEAGCKWVDFGIQHINEEYRKTYLKRNETNANIVNALNLLKKHDIVSFVDYIVGLPGDTMEHNEEARLFFIENMPDIIEPYWMSYHPKTEIIEKGFKHNVLNNETVDLIHQGRNPHSYFENSLNSRDFHSEYYFIFKVLPALPVFLRKKLTYNVSKKIPYFIKLPFFIYSIFYLALKHKSPRIKYLTTFYLKQIIWIMKSKVFPKKISSDNIG